MFIVAEVMRRAGSGPTSPAPPAPLPAPAPAPAPHRYECPPALSPINANTDTTQKM